MVAPPDGLACESSRLGRHLMLEDKQRLDTPTSAALRHGIGGIHLIDGGFRRIEQ
jgi:hypothetical protein